MSLKRYITNNSSWDFPTLYIPRTSFEGESESGIAYSQTLSVRNAARSFYQGTSTYNLDTLNISLSTSGLCDPGTIIINGVDTGETSISNYQVTQDLTITFSDPTPTDYTPTTKSITGYDTTTVFDLYDDVSYGFEINNPNGVSVLIDFDDALSATSYQNITIPANDIETIMSDGYTITESDILAGELYTYVDFTESDTSGQTLLTEQKTFNIPINIEEPRGHLIVELIENTSPADPSVGYDLGERISVDASIENDGNLTMTDINIAIENSSTTIESLMSSDGDYISEAYTINLTEADILGCNGELILSPIVTMNSPDPDEPDGNCSVTPITIPIVTPRGELTVTITESSGGPYRSGEYINVDVDIENTGNITLSDINLDIYPTGDQLSFDTLSPGDSETYQPSGYYYTGTGEADNGEIVFYTTVTARNGDITVINPSLSLPVENSLTIHYVYEDGTTAYDDYNGYYAYGETYYVSPTFKRYFDTYVDGTQTDSIYGTMGNSNIEITVTYVHRTAYHTIRHVFGNGNSAFPDVTLTGPEGDTETYTVPQLDGYTSTYQGTIPITYDNSYTTIFYIEEIVTE